MADEAWILVNPHEVIEEREKPIVGIIRGVYRRRVTRFTYTRKSHGDYSWAAHNQETQLKRAEQAAAATALKAALGRTETLLGEIKTELA